MTAAENTNVKEKLINLIQRQPDSIIEKVHPFAKFILYETIVKYTAQRNTITLEELEKEFEKQTNEEYFKALRNAHPDIDVSELFEDR